MEEKEGKAKKIMSNDYLQPHNLKINVSFNWNNTIQKFISHFSSTSKFSSLFSFNCRNLKVVVYCFLFTEYHNKIVDFQSIQYKSWVIHEAKFYAFFEQFFLNLYWLYATFQMIFSYFSLIKWSFFQKHVF